MSLEKHELMSSVQSDGVGQEGSRPTLEEEEEEEDSVDKSVDDQTKPSDDHSVSVITSKEPVVLTEEREGAPSPGVEAVCASVAQQKESREKRACVFVERLQRLKTRISVLDTSRLGRLGAEGTLLDEDLEGKDEFVTPRSTHDILKNDNEGENTTLKNVQIVTENGKSSVSEISNSKLVESVTAEVNMLNSVKSKQTKKQKVALKVGLHMKTRITKGKSKLNNKLSSKKK